MSIKKVLNILREPIRPTTDAIRMMRLERKIRETRAELEAVQEAQSKSEPGEFTKKVEGILWANRHTTDREIEELIKEACKRLDRQAEEIERLKAILAAVESVYPGRFKIEQALKGE